MGAVVAGFGTIGIVIALGYVLARTDVLGPDSRDLLSRTVFFVATPCLLFTTLQQSDPHKLLSGSLIVSAASVAAVSAVYVTVAALVWRRSAAHLTIGALSSSYVNAGNLGIPLAAYVLGNAAPIAPVMLLQLVVLAPVSFAILDTAASGHRPSFMRLIGMPLRNPVTLASLLGLVVAMTGWTPPRIVDEPIALIAGMAVPAALLAYGVSLRGAPRVGAGGSHNEVAVVALLKNVVQPLVAWAVARFVFGLTGTPLLAAVMTAALPTAQNVFVYAVRYDRAVALARDAVAVTTLLSVPAVFVIAAVLG